MLRDARMTVLGKLRRSIRSTNEWQLWAGSAIRHEGRKPGRLQANPDQTPEADIQSNPTPVYALRCRKAAVSPKGLVKWQLLCGCRIQKCELWDDHVIAFSILRAGRDDVLSNRINDGLTRFHDFGPCRVAEDFIFYT